MSFLKKVAGGFSSALGSAFGGPGDLEQLRRQSEATEFKRLREFSKRQRAEAALASKEGVGVSERPDIQLGHDIDLELLSQEEREFRATGRKADSLDNTGLLL